MVLRTWPMRKKMKWILKWPMTVLLLIRQFNNWFSFLFSIDVFLLWTFKTGRMLLSTKHRGILKYDPAWIYRSVQVSRNSKILASTAHENDTNSYKEDISTTMCMLWFKFFRLKFFKLISNFCACIRILQSGVTLEQIFIWVAFRDFHHFKNNPIDWNNEKCHLCQLQHVGVLFSLAL